MFISSMTGFARVSVTAKVSDLDYSWFWEIKSVNGKSLEVKTKLPLWLDGMSQAVKNQAGEFLTRGNVYASLEINSSNNEPELKINEGLLQKATQQAIKLYEMYPDKLQKPNVSDLFNIRGVTEVEDVKLKEEEIAELQSQLLLSFDQVCEALQQDRKDEGEKIKDVLLANLKLISDQVEKIEEIAAITPQKLRERVNAQVELLLEPNAQINEDRLAQEILLYITKADIREEIDRLKAHIKTAEDLLSAGGAAGRRLDFLCQELNRETNTVCSKSFDVGLTNIGMEVKALIEQFREQVQNIE